MINNKIALCFWAYHIDICHEILSLLYQHKDNIKVYIGLCNSNSKFDNANILNHLKQMDIEYVTYFCDNYGADISSFLKQIVDVKEKYFIKIHTKKSRLGLRNQINWRSPHLSSLLCNQKQITSNYLSLENNNAGMLCNKHFILCDQEHTNIDNIKHLCNIFDINYDNIKHKCFSAGTMFMSRTDLFQQYLHNRSKQINDLLLHETHKINDNNYGTYSHSMERMFGYFIYNNQQTIKGCETNEKCLQIKNPESETGYFTLVMLYNNDCYIHENINLYGKIISLTKDNVSIEWNHMPNNPVQNYIFIDNNTIVKKSNK